MRECTGKNFQSTSLTGLDADSVRKRMEETLRANASRPLYSGTAVSALLENAFLF